MNARHDYLSTACWHEANDGRPDLHTQCRAVCKYGEVPEMCSCPNHVAGEERGEAEVDLARAVARALLLEIGESRISPGLRRRVESDPSLWWLREQEQPPGEWKSDNTPKEADDV